MSCEELLSEEVRIGVLVSDHREVIELKRLKNKKTEMWSELLTCFVSSVLRCIVRATSAVVALTKSGVPFEGGPLSVLI